jgi:hypothetical protein
MDRRQEPAGVLGTHREAVQPAMHVVHRAGGVPQREVDQVIAVSEAQPRSSGASGRFRPGSFPSCSTPRCPVGPDAQLEPAFTVP